MEASLYRYTKLIKYKKQISESYLLYVKGLEMFNFENDT